MQRPDSQNLHFPDIRGEGGIKNESNASSDSQKLPSLGPIWKNEYGLKDMPGGAAQSSSSSASLLSNLPSGLPSSSASNASSPSAESSAFAPKNSPSSYNEAALEGLTLLMKSSASRGGGQANFSTLPDGHDDNSRIRQDAQNTLSSLADEANSQGKQGQNLPRIGGGEQQASNSSPNSGSLSMNVSPATESVKMSPLVTNFGPPRSGSGNKQDGSAQSNHMFPSVYSILGTQPPTSVQEGRASAATAASAMSDFSQLSNAALLHNIAQKGLPLPQRNDGESSRQETNPNSSVKLEGAAPGDDSMNEDNDPSSRKKKQRPFLDEKSMRKGMSAEPPTKKVKVMNDHSKKKKESSTEEAAGGEQSVPTPMNVSKLPGEEEVNPVPKQGQAVAEGVQSLEEIEERMNQIEHPEEIRKEEILSGDGDSSVPEKRDLMDVVNSEDNGDANMVEMKERDNFARSGQEQAPLELTKDTSAENVSLPSLPSSDSTVLEKIGDSSQVANAPSAAESPSQTPVPTSTEKDAQVSAGAGQPSQTPSPASVDRDTSCNNTAISEAITGESNAASVPSSTQGEERS